MRAFMYHRPGNEYKEFLIEESQEDINSHARPITQYVYKGILKGVLAEADVHQRLVWSQNAHPITHTIVQDGKPLAKEEDRLILDNRVFYIQNVDNLGSLGISTLYYVEERKDAK